MTKPLDLTFNIAVHTIAARLFPCGYDVTADQNAAPYSLDTLKAHVAVTGRILVWSGASDHTIFDCAETNWAFRAWHDWCHWRHNLPFTVAGERAVATIQKEHLATVYPGRSELARWQRLGDIEVCEQVEHLTTTGQFVADQMAFTVERLAA
jgi:hypothetical protein